jgi:hypothetical protein
MSHHAAQEIEPFAVPDESRSSRTTAGAIKAVGHADDIFPSSVSADTAFAFGFTVARIWPPHCIVSIATKPTCSNRLKACNIEV